MEDLQLFVDHMTGRFFYASVSDLKAHIEEVNAQIIDNQNKSSSDLITVTQWLKSYKKRFKQNKRHRRGKY